MLAKNAEIYGEPTKVPGPRKVMGLATPKSLRASQPVTRRLAKKPAFDPGMYMERTHQELFAMFQDETLTKEQFQEVKDLQRSRHRIDYSNVLLPHMREAIDAARGQQGRQWRG